MNCERELICLVSHPRSGSTVFMRGAQDRFDLNAFYEVFHSHENIVQEHITQALGSAGLQKIVETVASDAKAGFREFSLTFPDQYLTLLHRNSNAAHMFFKIFPGHIKNLESLKSTLMRADKVIFLLRNTLHSYISDRIARKVGTYANVKTSHLKVEYVERDFVSWHNQIVNYFSCVKEILAKIEKDSLFLHYEDMYLSGDTEAYYRDFASFCKLNFVESKEAEPALRKQDHRFSAIEKVSNPSDMIESLSTLGVEYMLDGRERVSELEVLRRSV